MSKASLVQRLKFALRRTMHSYGFSVHSPFAFRFITECLRERWPYYAYAKFDGYDQCLAFRMAVFFQPERIVAIGKGAKRLAAAARLACPRPMAQESLTVRDLAQPCSLLVLAGADASAQEVERQCTDGAVVLVLGSKPAAEALSRRLDALGWGMDFIDGRGNAVGACLSKLPRQSYFPNIL